MIASKLPLSINCAGKLLCLQQPRIMGILNLTPDSFFDGGKYNNEQLQLRQVEKMLQEGADLIDIGAISSRPGALPIAEAKELNILLPCLKAIMRHFPHTIVSIDTYRANVAAALIQEGASLINDISGGNFDAQLPQLLVGKSIPYIIMHLQGTPQNMQINPQYHNVVSEVYDFLTQRAHLYKQMGIKDVIIDPGFGFGKSLHHNYELLQNLNEFEQSGLPLLVGVSRKSMIYKPLNIDPQDALNGTTVLNTLALQKGAQLLRVHDVKQAKETQILLQQVQLLHN